MSEAGRRRLVAGAVLVALVAVALVALSERDAGDGSLESRPPAAAGAPNIVVLLTDDMSVDDMAFLPKTRRLLGRAGATFTGFTAPQPLCCPSRAQLLTGQYAQNNGVRHNNGPYGGYRAFTPDTAMPVWLQDAGYETAMVGKYLNGYGIKTAEGVGQEVGWDHWDPTVRKIYRYFNFTQFNDGDPIKPVGYHTDYIASRSEDLIGQMSDDGRPFFLWSSFVAPHGVCQPKEEAGGCDTPPLAAHQYRGTHHHTADGVFARPSFNEDNQGKPPALARLGKVARGDVQRVRNHRADALSSVDDAVEGIVSSLKETGQLDNTVIFFTSDNGYLLGEHRYVGKVLAYEESVRVPLLVRGPGIPAGSVDNQTAAMIDLAPTFAALADATPQIPVDGHPLVLRRTGSNATDQRTLLVQAGVSDLEKFPTGWWFRGVRTPRYTYVHWEKSGFVELYDRRRDAYEIDNVAASPAYRAVRRELARRTRVLGTCSGASCDRDFGPMPGPGVSGPRRSEPAAARLAR